MEGRTVKYPSVVDEASPNFLHAQARITAIYGDDAERAIEQFRHRITSDTGAASRAARYGLALAALKTGEFEVAIEQAHRLWESDPDDPFYVVGLAESYQGRGDISTALGVLAADYPVDADDPVLSSYYADALIKAGKPAKAKPVIRAGLRAAPHSIVLFRLLARAEGELGRLAESFQALAETHYLSGDLGLALEKLELAVKHTGNSAYLKASIAARQAEIQQELDDQKG
jgi:predicted Zn-dependent protease